MKSTLPTYVSIRRDHLACLASPSSANLLEYARGRKPENFSSIADACVASAYEEAVSAANRALRRPQGEAPIRLHFAAVTNPCGTVFLSGHTKAAMRAALAKYCTDLWGGHWKDAIEAYASENELSNNPEYLTDTQIIQIYFDACDCDAEYVDYGQSVISLPIEVAAHLRHSIVATVIPDLPTLPGADALTDLAQVLDDGASADIWFSPQLPSEQSYATRIDEAQEAMRAAANQLMVLARFKQGTGEGTPSNALVLRESDTFYDLASALDDACADDIWFDPHLPDEAVAASTIASTKNAMSAAAALFKELADQATLQYVS